MPEKAVKLTLYNGLRNWMMDKETQHVTYTQEALAGMGTAFVQVLVTNPYELIKVRQQTVVGQPITETMRELGLKGLSQGMGACLMRDIPFNMLYFSSYAVLKDNLKSKDGSPLSPQSLMAAGLGAGLLAGSVTTPADVVKTRMQTDKTGRYKSLLDCVGKMWREEGPQAFLKGLGPRVMLIPPLFAITMTCFETLQRTWFPQTVASPGLKHLPADQGGSSARATMTDMVKHKLEQLERNLALKPAASN
jgi:solute carrier family 25 aspartate/glutamate transporter 12/13